MEPALQPGAVLAERYRLVCPLARGGMGSVWRAEHLALNASVAVKIIDPRIASQERGVARFLREARALASLRSPYIVQVTDFGSHGGSVYLVMELLEGKTLAQRLAEGRLSAGETRRVFRDVCKGVGHAHERGLVHRDLKPANIFLCDSSREHVTKVLDFGIAKPTPDQGESSTESGTGAFVGTPSYMSPEQCRGSAEVDQRSDLWALGAIAYECLSGERLFRGDAVGDLLIRICMQELPLNGASELPPGFDGWLRKAMARSPDGRFQSAAQLFDALSLVLAGAREPVLSVDAAETLSEAGAEPSAVGLAEPLLPAQPPSAPNVFASTFAKVALESTLPQTQTKRRAVWAIAAGGVSFAAAFTLAGLLRSPSSQAVPADEPRVATGAAVGRDEAGGAVAERGLAPRESRPYGAADAGGTVRLSGDSWDRSEPAVEQQPVRVEAPARPAPSPTPPLRRGDPRRDPAPEVDLLRRQR